ncbi:MAG: hypothetical protein HY399_06770 [Elusimicrobia bacterium]|nr:hypothetical protein [Elusimicrobiota bacterium]
MRQRHSIISSGLETEWVMGEFLGHDHLSTTEIYLNLSPEKALDEFHEKW